EDHEVHVLRGEPRERLVRREYETVPLRAADSLVPDRKLPAAWYHEQAVAVGSRPHDVCHGDLVAEHVPDVRPFLRGAEERARRGALAGKIHDEDAEAVMAGQGAREVRGDGRLADAALLHGEGQDARRHRSSVKPGWVYVPHIPVAPQGVSHVPHIRPFTLNEAKLRRGEDESKNGGCAAHAPKAPCSAHSPEDPP